ncbi:ANTAR domain-containing protein [Kribbella sp. CA-293567]|uniref:ANTAR domain-containing protein n=1 Tax=Kribbella sp. CA-293567 TaxID=3002436 RepID=UPI0022DD1464|nr:ANTAR domain-containing protein [Kribbella sp. CA-293567]WBQ03486.1 ANTAR domain-containing protein [Kribbella sp. CA-293567]
MESAVLQQAVGILMDWYGVPPEAAIEQLEQWATDCGAASWEVAEGLVHGICLGRPTACREEVLRHLEQLLRQFPATAQLPD